MNETTELIMKQLNSKKVHAETHELGGGDEIDVLKLKNAGSLVTKTGDFSGTWNGLVMTSTEPGLSTAFNALKADNVSRAINVKYPPSPLVAAVNDGTTDNTPTIQAMIDYLNTLGGGSLYFPKGEYLLNGIVYICSNLTLYGDKNSVIKGNTVLLRNYVVGAGSANINENMKNIDIHHLTFKSTVNVFSEFIGLISLSFVSDIKIHDCQFIGWQGDAIVISGSAGVYGAIRHNTNVHIYDCLFDGVNNDNRQAISFTDIDGAIVERCVFKNTTRSDMPGAIDFEPNPSPVESVIMNVVVRDCSFSNVGGMNGCISVHLPLSQEQMTTPANNFVFENNTIDSPNGSQRGIVVNQVITALLDTTPANNVKIIGNKLINITNYPIQINGIGGYMLGKNTLQDCGAAVLIGATTATIRTKDGDIYKNTFRRCGKTGGNGIVIYGVNRLNIADNKFEDCGTGGGGTSNAIDFASGVSTYVKIINNIFTSPTSKTLVAIQKEAAHTFTPATNVYESNRLVNIANNFFQTTQANLVWNVPSLVDGATIVSANISVIGAVQGDYVLVSSQFDLQGLVCTAYVSAADTVKIVLFNKTGAAIDLANQRWYVRIIKNDFII